MAAWNPLYHLTSHSPSTHHSYPARALKRRLDPDDEDDSGRKDIVMDRSPTPERAKRTAPKRLRTVPSTESGVRDERTSKENKAPGSDVDIGVLLATLPPQSLLPILTSLISAQPSLKPAVLELIPRPTVDTAVQAIAQSAKKLKDAYPYSNTSSFTSSSITSFGFGSTSTSQRSSGFGLGRSGSHQLLFGQTNVNNNQHGGMREEYIVSRLRPHISDFVAACFSYLPYFSYVSPQSLASTSQKSHPSETFAFLSALTSHVLSQPPLTQTSLVPAVLPRLLEEWKAWVRELDDIVNRQAGMFGVETVKGWEKELDEFAHAKDHGLEVLREIRDTWVGKVGWLVGRRLEYRMDDEEL